MATHARAAAHYGWAVYVSNGFFKYAYMVQSYVPNGMDDAWAAAWIWRYWRMGRLE